jgi:hypothetical protein
MVLLAYLLPALMVLLRVELVMEVLANSKLIHVLEITAVQVLLLVKLHVVWIQIAKIALLNA